MADSSATLAEVLRLLQGIEVRLQKIEGDGGRTYAEVTQAAPRATETRTTTAAVGPTTGASSATPSVVSNPTTAPPRILPGPRPQVVIPEHTRANQDTALLSHSLFRVVQLQHHIGIWRRLPEKISRGLDEVFYAISPPMPDQDLVEDLRGVYNRLTKEIKEIVGNHMEGKLESTKRIITRCNPYDQLRATNQARDLIERRLGKVQKRRANAWLDEALDWVGTRQFDTVQQGREEVHGANTREPPTGTGTEETRDPPMEAEEGGAGANNRKRKIDRGSPARGPAPIETSNRFNVLADAGEEGIGGDQEEELGTAEEERVNKTPDQRSKKRNNASSPPTTHQETNGGAPGADHGSPQDRAASQPHPTGMGETETITISPISASQGAARSVESKTTGKYIYRSENKAQWSLKTRRPNVTLIIGDSNLRLINETPEEWETHVFPGAYLDHGHKLLANLKGPTPDKIVIALGINNKAQDMSSWWKDLKLTHTTATKLTTETYFLGISTTRNSGLNNAHHETVAEINRKAEQLFGKRYIRPLPQDKVSIVPSDLCKIHHSADTVSRIRDSIEDHLNGNVPLN